MGIAAEPTSSTNDSLKVSDSGVHHAPQIHLKEATLSNTLICSRQWLILLQHSNGTLSLDSEHTVCDISSFSKKQGALCIIDSAANKYSVCCSIPFFHEISLGNDAITKGWNYILYNHKIFTRESE